MAKAETIKASVVVCHTRYAVELVKRPRFSSRDVLALIDNDKLLFSTNLSRMELAEHAVAFAATEHRWDLIKRNFNWEALDKQAEVGDARYKLSITRVWLGAQGYIVDPLRRRITIANAEKIAVVIAALQAGDEAWRLWRVNVQRAALQAAQRDSTNHETLPERDKPADMLEDFRAAMKKIAREPDDAPPPLLPD